MAHLNFFLSLNNFSGYPSSNFSPFIALQELPTLSQTKATFVSQSSKVLHNLTQIYFYSFTTHYQLSPWLRSPSRSPTFSMSCSFSKHSFYQKAFRARALLFSSWRPTMSLFPICAHILSFHYSCKHLWSTYFVPDIASPTLGDKSDQ